MASRILYHQAMTEIDIGRRSPGCPCHTTLRTGPYTAVRRVELATDGQRRKPRARKKALGSAIARARTVRQMPRAMGTAGRLSGQVLTHATFPQFRKPFRPVLPLLPDHRSQSASAPFLKALQHARHFPLTEIADPALVNSGPDLRPSARCSLRGVASVLGLAP